MSIKRFGIKNFLAGGFLAFAVILLVFSLSVSKLPGNTEREAVKVSRAVSKRLHILDEYNEREYQYLQLLLFFLHLLVLLCQLL